MNWDVQKLQNWFKIHIKDNGEPFALDEDQARIVLNEHKNALVTARAGSGKTRTIIASIIFLIFYKKINPSEIIVFAFNKKAANQINDRLANITYDGTPTNLGTQKIGTTFHSFACRVTHNYRAILSDQEKTNNSIGDRTFYIKTLLRRVDIKKLYDFIHDQKEPVKETSESQRDYYLRIRNLQFDTLDGKKVRSFTEKIICDYLFEHGISYSNEIEYYPKTVSNFIENPTDRDKLAQKERIKPDFYLNDYDLVWENWGISGQESKQQINEINARGIFDGGYERYQNKMEWKKWFYQRDWLESLQYNEESRKSRSLQNIRDYEALIETYRNPATTRDDFEKDIEKTLSQYGITVKKLSEQELFERFAECEKCIDKIAGLVIQFIDRAEQQFFGNYEKLKKHCMQEKNEEIRSFYEIALEVFDNYLQELHENRKDDINSRLLLNELYPEKRYTTDFNILLDEAAIALKKNSNHNFKYIFIDEFQDLSPLFYQLVTEVRNHCNSSTLICVGDDWQAINGYAGSDLKYFQFFEKYFPEDNHRYNILKNYRSNKTIVDVSNDFMSKMIHDEMGGEATKENHEKCFYSCPVKKKYGDGSPVAKNYKAFSEAISDIIFTNRDKTIRILNRKDEITKLGIKNMGAMEQNFKSLFKNKIKMDFLNDDNFQCSTVHKAKGTESDIVILFGDNVNDFPLIHSDTKYFSVFGDSEEKSLDEEKRLFYVALTRAKEKIYIVRNDVDLKGVRHG